MAIFAVPVDALYGASTQRAVENFPISGRTMDPAIIHAYGLIKEAAALANAELGELLEDLAQTIAAAAARFPRGNTTHISPSMSIRPAPAPPRT